MEPIAQFLWGFAGSLAVEVATLANGVRAGRPVPKRFRRASYWLMSLLTATVGGLVAIAAQVQNPLFAMHLGAGTPLLLDRWQKTVPGAGSSTKE